MAASISEVNRMVRQSDNVRLSSESINQLAGVVIDAVMSMPNPVVSVQDINAGQNESFGSTRFLRPSNINQLVQGWRLMQKALSLHVLQQKQTYEI